MKTKQKVPTSLVASLIVIIIFFLYTLYIPTIGLDMVTKVLLDIILILLVLFVYHDSILDDLKAFGSHYKKYLKGILIFWLIMFISGYVINGVLDVAFGFTSENNEAQLSLLKNAPYYFAFSTLIFSPIVEELSIRKAFREILSHKWLYLIISSLVHSVLYVIFATEASSLLFLIPYFIMAIITAYSYIKYDNILVPISIHLLQNIVSFLVNLLYLITIS